MGFMTFLNRVGVNSISELELPLNSHSEIEIGGIENGIGSENPEIGTGIENRNCFFATVTTALSS